MPKLGIEWHELKRNSANSPIDQDSSNYLVEPFRGLPMSGVH